jgi:lytic murein transglycosylase
MIARLILAAALGAAVSIPFAIPAVAQDFRACLSGLKTDAASKGISAATFDAATRGLQPDMKVLEFLDFQPEFKTPIWDYLAALVDEQRVVDGRAMLRQYGNALAAAQQKYGVDPATVIAVWGVESDYGRAIGKRPLVQSLATLSCYGRRQPFFRGELIATLTILQRGDVNPDHLVGSWAGAFGHTQFMPSTYLRNAVDHDGDGRKASTRRSRGARRSVTLRNGPPQVFVARMVSRCLRPVRRA